MSLLRSPARLLARARTVAGVRPLTTAAASNVASWKRAYTPGLLTQAELQQAVRHIGVVRYDAFGDMGGRMSFSAAMVDDHGNGFVITTIHARSESRSYIKELRGGMAEVNLSPEETAAVGDAVAGIPDGRIE